jgi:hypothetical protein
MEPLGGVLGEKLLLKSEEQRAESKEQKHKKGGRRSNFLTCI